MYIYRYRYVYMDTRIYLRAGWVCALARARVGGAVFALVRTTRGQRRPRLTPPGCQTNETALCVDEKTTIQPATFRWLDDHLSRLEKSKPTVLFTHFPLGEKVTYRPLNAEALLERFREFNLVSVFNGHFHGFTERQFQHA